MRILIATAALVALALGASPAAWAEDASFLIVNPGGRGNQSKAQGFLRDFAQALGAAWPADAGPAPSWTGNYHVTEADALASIRARHPALALVTPGFLEAHAAELGFTAVATPVRESGAPRRIQLVTRQADVGTAGRIASGALGGLRFGGQVAAEPAWARRHVLAPLGEAADAVLVVYERSLQAVRAVQEGTIDVALLEGDDWQRLLDLGRAEGLAAVRATATLADGPAVALVDPTASPEARSRQRALGLAAGRALARFHEVAEGRNVLERMTLERYDLVPGSD